MKDKLGFEYDHEAAEVEENTKALLESTKNICTNGKDPKSLSKHDYLTEFKQGPCTPIVVIPGIAGSKLRAEIDCPTFKNADPSGFAACGWKRCEGLQSPNKEYKIWIPGTLAPMSIYLDTEAARNCFIAVFGQDSSEISKGIIKARPGIKVSPEGTSTESKLKSVANCGATAMEDMQTIPQSDGSYYFKKFRETAENAGYIIGLTYQPLPYDFRLGYQQNELNRRFKGVISELSNNLGKKVTIYAHSFGNLNTVHNLVKNMSQAEKDKYIARYIALAPPFVGSPQAAEGQIGLDNSLAEDLIFAEVGVTAAMQEHTVSLMKGLFNLMPKNTFKRWANSSWMRALQGRIDAEKHGKRFDTSTVVNLFPQPTASCLPGFSSRDEFCNFGFVDMTIFGKVEDDDVSWDTIEKIFKKYAIVDDSDVVWKSVQDNLFEDLPNTGVQTSIVFSGSVNTMSYFEFDENPRLKTKQGKYVMPTFTLTHHGDGLVLSTSALVPGIKWADDFRNKAANSKPVNMVEVCSTYQRRPDVFTPGKKQVDDNAYFGIDCECGGTRLFPRDGKRCGHTTFLMDTKVISFLLKSAADGNAAVETSASQAFFAKSEYDLDNYENQCLLINNN